MTKSGGACNLPQPTTIRHIYGPYQWLSAGPYAVEFEIAAVNEQSFDHDMGPAG